jgi:membrane protease YdiL (CAAX protease family)
MNNPIRRNDAFPMAVVVEGAIALVAVALAWLFGVPLPEQFPTGMPLVWAIVRGIAVAIPLFALFLWMRHSIWAPLRQLRQQVEMLIGAMFPAASIGQLAMVAVLAGVGEELLFRGVVQTKLIDWTTPAAGILLASLLFGLAHSLSKLYFFLATLIGLCFGWMTWQYNDLVAPMVAHTLYDFAALWWLCRKRRRATSIISDDKPS